MVHISILVLRNAIPAAIADAAYLFTIVNKLLKEYGKEPLFAIHLVRASSTTSLNSDFFEAKSVQLLEEIKDTDLVIIPSFAGDAVGAAYLNRDYVPWIAKQYKEGAEVASLCTGAFLLAYTGLLKKKQCTTHWAYANEFRYYFPDVQLVDEKMITHQQGLYSSGGNNAYWNLLLYLVEKYTNRAIAIHTAKFFVIDPDRKDQSPFVIFHGQKNHKDETILRTQEYIERKYADKLTVDGIAREFNLGRRTFERRFKKATHSTVVEYIQQVKIEATKKALEMGRKSIREVMQDVGYSDSKTFRDVFKKITCITPNEYRKKYNREV